MQGGEHAQRGEGRLRNFGEMRAGGFGLRQFVSPENGVSDIHRSFQGNGGRRQKEFFEDFLTKTKGRIMSLWRIKIIFLNLFDFFVKNKKITKFV